MPTSGVFVGCLQIHDEAKKFAYQTGIRVVVAYGGAPVHNQVCFQPRLRLEQVFVGLPLQDVLWGVIPQLLVDVSSSLLGGLSLAKRPQSEVLGVVLTTACVKDSS